MAKYREPSHKDRMDYVELNSHSAMPNEEASESDDDSSAPLPTAPPVNIACGVVSSHAIPAEHSGESDDSESGDSESPDRIPHYRYPDSIYDADVHPDDNPDDWMIDPEYDWMDDRVRRRARETQAAADKQATALHEAATRKGQRRLDETFPGYHCFELLNSGPGLGTDEGAAATLQPQACALARPVRCTPAVAIDAIAIEAAARKKRRLDGAS